jgi:hypothetical protein
MSNMAVKDLSPEETFRRMIRNTAALDAFSGQIQESTEQLAKALTEYMELIK